MSAPNMCVFVVGVRLLHLRACTAVSHMRCECVCVCAVCFAKTYVEIVADSSGADSGKKSRVEWVLWDGNQEAVFRTPI